MRYAKSMYLAGDVIDALEVDSYSMSRDYGIKCPFCGEALFFKKGYKRGSGTHVKACFSHYEGKDESCELRASRPEGVEFVKKLAVESKGQRLKLYNAHLLDIMNEACGAMKLESANEVLKDFGRKEFSSKKMDRVGRAVYQHITSPKGVAFLSKIENDVVEGRIEQDLCRFDPSEYDQEWHRRICWEILDFFGSKTGRFARRAFVKIFYASLILSEASKRKDENSLFYKEKIWQEIERRDSSDVLHGLALYVFAGDWRPAIHKYLTKAKYLS